jgi:hypothetical protein
VENSTIIDETTMNSHPGILKKTPDENIRRKTKNNKQYDEKKEKGSAQIFIPSNLIFAGNHPYLQSFPNKIKFFRN